MDYYFEENREGVAFFKRQTLDFASHLHSDIELVYVSSGSVDAYVEGEKFNLKSGDFLLVFPNQIHSYEGSVGVDTKYIIFSADIIPEYKKLFWNKATLMPVIRNCESASLLMDVLFENYNTTSRSVVRGLVLSVVGMLLDKMEFCDVDKYHISTLKNLLIYCNEHFAEPITMTDAANELHVSRTHISHIFRDKLHTTFGTYISKKRIEYACTLLSNGSHNITETAFASGFGSIRSFNRTFMKIMNMSPQKYKKQTKV